MSESQSRYSIVERLTSLKIGFINSKNGIDAEMEDLKQTIREKEKDLEAYTKDAKEDINRMLRARQKEIDNCSSQLRFKEQRKGAMVQALDAQIAEVDKALRSIEEISKTAPTPEQQATRK